MLVGPPWSRAITLIVPLQAGGLRGAGDHRRPGVGRAWSRPAQPALALLGYLITMYDKRLGIHTAYEDAPRDDVRRRRLQDPFPLAKDFKEAVASRKPIAHYKPKGAAAKACQGRGRRAAGAACIDTVQRPGERRVA